MEAISAFDKNKIERCICGIEYRGRQKAELVKSSWDGTVMSVPQWVLNCSGLLKGPACLDLQVLGHSSWCCYLWPDHFARLCAREGMRRWPECGRSGCSSWLLTSAALALSQALGVGPMHGSLSFSFPSSPPAFLSLPPLLTLLLKYVLCSTGPWLAPGH